MWCLNCRSFVVKGKWCPECGGKLIVEDAKCPYCGKEVMLWNNFCGECGRPIQAEMKELAEKR